MKNISTGSYRLTAYAQDDDLNNGRPVVNYGYTIWVDDKLPTLTLDNVEQDESGKLVGFTNHNPYVVKATITDNLAGYNLSINHNHVHTDSDYDVFNEAFFANRPAVDVAYKVKILPEETSKMTATLTDLVGNKQQLDFDIHHHKDEAISAPEITSNETSLTNKPIVLTPKNKESVIKHAGKFSAPELYYSTDQNTWTLVPDTITVSENGDYFFKYSDKYGNESPVTHTAIQTIRSEVKALPTVSLSSYGGKEKQVTVTLGMTAKDEHTSIKYSLDEGKTWEDYKDAFVVTKNSVLQVKTVDTASNESPVFSENIMVKPSSVETTDSGTQTDLPTKKEDELTKDNDKKGTDSDDKSKEGNPPFEKNKDNSEKDKEDKKSENSVISQAPIGFIDGNINKYSATSNQSSTQHTQQGSKITKALPKTGEVENKKVFILGLLMLSLLSISWFGKHKRNKKNS